MYDQNHGVAIVTNSLGLITNQDIYSTNDGWVSSKKIKLPDSDKIIGREREFDFHHTLIKYLTINTFICNLYLSKIENGITYIDEVLGRTTDGGETSLINKNQISYIVLRYNQIISKAKYSFSEKRF
jgi:hypothetical protein